MEFWIFPLFLCVFSLWVQSRIRRRTEGQRFANVMEALNRIEPRLNIGLVDTLRLHGSDRFLNLIIFGAICILISFLYTRYWDVIRRYL